MSDETEQKFGLEGIEQSQGYEPMPLASPAPANDDLADAGETLTQAELNRARRPIEADWGREVEREYYNNQTGEPTPENQTVSPEQAAHDLSATRAQEAKAREVEAEEALRAALDGTEQPSPQPDQPQPDQPHDQMGEDAARAHQDAAWAEADKAIERVLQEPLVRERIEQSFNAVRQEASTRVEQANTAAEQAQRQYNEATVALSQQVDAMLLVQFPELQGVAGNPQATAGALQMLQKTNPARFAELTNFANQAAVVTQHAMQARAEQQAQQQQQMQAQTQQYAEVMENYTKAEVKKYEQMTASDSPETHRAIRENLAPVIKERYGVDFDTLKGIHDGKILMSATEFTRSAPFQAMLHDAIKFRLAQQGVTAARSNPVPKVQRPGVASDGPTTESDYASLERSLHGKSLNPKQAADLLIAHRARR